MTPIYFCSFGGYRRFSRTWWKRLLYYITGIDLGCGLTNVRWGTTGWPHDLYTFYHRGRYGWAPRDTWSLDTYLNQVLGHTLIHLADTSHGSPAGYPHKDGAEDTNHAQWEADLRRWGQAFLDLHAWQQEEFMTYGGDHKARLREEHRRYQKVRAALRELGPWWGGLWD